MFPSAFYILVLISEVLEEDTDMLDGCKDKRRIYDIAPQGSSLLEFVCPTADERHRMAGEDKRKNWCGRGQSMVVSHMEWQRNIVTGVIPLRRRRTMHMTEGRFSLQKPSLDVLDGTSRGLQNKEQQ